MARGTVRVLITAGPTREYLDPVRFISNPSSGLMGILVARACLRRGWSVCLVAGPTGVRPPKGCRVVRVETADQMRREVLRLLPSCDAVVMAAAVTDWKPAARRRLKMKRKQRWLLPLVPTPDILAEVARNRNRDQYVIGFALETHRMVAHAREKMVKKDVDCIVANTPAFFGKGRDGQAAIISAGRTRLYPRASKAQIASRVAALIAERFPSRKSPARN